MFTHIILTAAAVSFTLSAAQSTCSYTNSALGPTPYSWPSAGNGLNDLPAKFTFMDSFSKVTNDASGMKLCLSQEGQYYQALTFVADFYIMYGKVSITMKTAHGNGLVSTMIMNSSTSEEIDWEVLGTTDQQYSGAAQPVQANVFAANHGVYNNLFLSKDPNTNAEYGKPVASSASPADHASGYHTYGIEYTKDLITWSVDEAVVGSFARSEADAQHAFVSTPMRFQFGLWAEQGANSWSGPSDVSTGQGCMYVSGITAVDYSAGDGQGDYVFNGCSAGSPVSGGSVYAGGPKSSGTTGASTMSASTSSSTDNVSPQKSSSSSSYSSSSTTMTRPTSSSHTTSSSSMSTQPKPVTTASTTQAAAHTTGPYTIQSPYSCAANIAMKTSVFFGGLGQTAAVAVVPQDGGAPVYDQIGCFERFSLPAGCTATATLNIITTFMPQQAYGKVRRSLADSAPISTSAAGSLDLGMIIVGAMCASIIALLCIL